MVDSARAYVSISLEVEDITFQKYKFVDTHLKHFVILCKTILYIYTCNVERCNVIMECGGVWMGYVSRKSHTCASSYLSIVSTFVHIWSQNSSYISNNNQQHVGKIWNNSSAHGQNWTTWQRTTTCRSRRYIMKIRSIKVKGLFCVRGYWGLSRLAVSSSRNANAMQRYEGRLWCLWNMMAAGVAICAACRYLIYILCIWSWSRLLLKFSATHTLEFYKLECLFHLWTGMQTWIKLLLKANILESTEFEYYR